MAQPIFDHIDDKESVFLHEDVVIIHGFEETDPDVVALIEETDEPVAAMHRIIQLGARAGKLVQTTVDTQLVEHRFDQMSTRFSEDVDDAVSSVQKATAELLDDEGILTVALTGWQREVTDFINSTFDENDKRSAIAKIETTVDKILTAQTKAVHRALDPSHDDSPLGKLRNDMNKVVCKEVGEVRAAVIDLSERFAVAEAEADMAERTAIKGMAFEDMAHAKISAIVAPYGDEAEQTGNIVGFDGTKKGDEVVTLDSSDTLGSAESYVLEIKDRKLGQRATYEELDAAMCNRGSRAGIAVFSSQAKCPSSAPFTYAGNRAIVVLDKQDPDERNLRLACMWARWVVRRQLGETTAGLDIQAIETLLDEAGSILGRIRSIRGCHTSAKKQIDRASELVDGLSSELDTVLDRLRNELE